MKNTIKRILTIITISTLISGTVIGSGYTQNIEVMMNSIIIKVNGEYMSGDNILYKGTTYVPLRAAGEALGKDIAWDKKTKTATINDKVFDSTGGEFKVPGGIPDGATLIESIPEYKCHKYSYNVNLDGGGRITHFTISNAPSEGPHISIMGYDNNNTPFLRGKYKDGNSHSVVSDFNNYRVSVFTDPDYEIMDREMDKFFNVYGY